MMITVSERIKIVKERDKKSIVQQIKSKNSKNTCRRLNRCVETESERESMYSFCEVAQFVLESRVYASHAVSNRFIPCPAKLRFLMKRDKDCQCENAKTDDFTF